MRTIKSQDGKMIVNAEKVNRFCVDKIEEEYEKNFCLWRIYVIFNAWTKIADYSTEKRALRVLDMLNDWLIQPCEAIFADITLSDAEKREQIFSRLKKSQYFQMPQDSEELD